MDFECSNKFGFIMQLLNFGFVHKLDLEVQDYTEGELICQRVNGDFNQNIITQKRV